MALDTLIEAFVEAVLRPVAQRVLHPIGWFALRLLTLGHYPPRDGAPHNRDFVAGFAAVPLVLLLLLATGQFG